MADHPWRFAHIPSINGSTVGFQFNELEVWYAGSLGTAAHKEKLCIFIDISTMHRSNYSNKLTGHAHCTKLCCSMLAFTFHLCSGSIGWYEFLIELFMVIACLLLLNIRLGSFFFLYHISVWSSFGWWWYALQILITVGTSLECLFAQCVFLVGKVLL